VIPAALYARFSSDLQRDRSIDDQVALLREFAAKNGYRIVAVYEDRATSGATFRTRPGIQQLLAGARDRAFDAVLAESMSRIGRDQESRAHVRKHLRHAGVKIVTPADGVVTNLTDGIRAVMDDQYLEDLKAAVYRGMKGVIRDGRNAGGRAYGYRPVLGKPGELEIVAAEAAVIVRVFERYLAGDVPADIAAALNAEGVPAPRGKFWRAGTILGSQQRGHGILQNEIYCGRIVWNRVRMVRDPDTEKRVSRVNPEAEWQRVDAPHLRIVSEEIFQAARRRRRDRTKVQPRDRQRPRHALSGLLRCGACDAGMQVKDRDHGRLRVICSNVKERGACDNRRAYYLDDIERAVVAIFRENIGNRSAIGYYIRVFNDENRRASAAAIASRHRLEVRLAEAQRGLDRLIDAVARGTILAEEADARVPQLRAERDAAKAELDAAEQPAKVVTLHPGAVDEYLRNLDRLAELIGADLREDDDGLARALRGLITTVTVLPAPRGEAPLVRLTGHLATLLGRAVFPHGSYSGGRLVAEGRFNTLPPTAPVFTLERRAG
jgi:DNA invertase Pin-like site-specific DNA recombinase